ncbi:hypothetical protein [Luteolibacter marinus]|uniref:hypothetical protein n=1 Tax=Luteolibacter marinus TaxID=2776705 RepID=UPI001868A915|nr:hypothetical protein [Luteolibacter marinus]
MPALNPKPYRRFNRVLLGTAGGIVLLFIAFNTWVNPLWVTPAPWTNKDLAEYRPIYRQQRTGKAGLVRSVPWQVGFFGSSRVDIAYDPMLPGWGDKKVVNLAVSAGTLPETAAIVRYTLDRCPLETAIVGIDLGDLTGANSGYRTTGFMESPFNPKGDAIERELRYLGGISTFEAAVNTLRNKSKGKLPEYTPQGHRLRHQDKPDVRKIIYDDAIPHALRATRRRKHAAQVHQYAGNEWKMSLLRQILDDTKKHGVRLVLTIPPSHATYISVYEFAGDPDPFFSLDREIMTRLVADSNAAHPDAPPAEIWDFNDYHPLNCEQIPPHGIRMHWWLDGTHARKALGDVMLARIMGWPVPEGGEGYGFQLTAANAAQRIESLKANYVQFGKEHRDMYDWMVEGIESYQSTGDPGAAEPEGAQAF